MESTRTVVLKNRYGLHARPATAIAQTASRFRAQVFFTKDGAEVDGKSIFGLLTLEATSGTELGIRAVGDDAPAAVDALVDLIERRFDEESFERTEGETKGAEV